MKWKKIGFKIHDNVKDYFSRIVLDEKSRFRGRLKFVRENFVKPTDNDKYDYFLFNNSYSDDWDSEGNDTSYELNLLSSTQMGTIYAELKKLFNPSWIKISDFGYRIHIGNLEHKIGRVYMFINNNSGKFEWIYFKENCNIYIENPNGIIGDNVDEFLHKFQRL